jgi:hypothetical protein
LLKKLWECFNCFRFELRVVVLVNIVTLSDNRTATISRIELNLAGEERWKIKIQLRIPVSGSLRNSWNRGSEKSKIV